MCISQDTPKVVQSDPVADQAKIDAEATATGNSPTDVTNFILYTASIWEDKGSKIEGARQAAKIGVNTDTTLLRVNSVFGSNTKYFTVRLTAFSNHKNNLRTFILSNALGWRRSVF